MKKLIAIIIAAIVILFVAFIIVWNMLPSIISSKLTKMAKVPVSITDIHFSTKSVEVERLKVKNPKGSVLDDALTVRTITADVPLTRFFKKEVVINQLLLDKVYISIEFDSKNSNQGNWSTIMNNLNESLASSLETKEEDQRGVLIKKLILENIKVDLVYRDTKEVQRLKKINRIELDNISSKGGVPSAQIMNIVMREVLRNIFSVENLKNMLQDIIQPGGSGFTDTLKRLFSEAEEQDNAA